LHDDALKSSHMCYSTTDSFTTIQAA
jgi:hypothetical protein